MWTCEKKNNTLSTGKSSVNLDNDQKAGMLYTKCGNTTLISFPPLYQIISMIKGFRFIFS